MAESASHKPPSQDHGTPSENAWPLNGTDSSGRGSGFTAASEGEIPTEDPIAAEEDIDEDNEPIIHIYARQQVVSTPNGKGTVRHGSRVPLRSARATLTDPTVLDCPICFDPLSPPVYQCENGHVACASCCATTIRATCSSCSCPIGNKRCRAMEKILDSVSIACRNRPRGCMVKMSYSTKLAHEKTCDYAPCWCPDPLCGFVCSCESLKQHFWDVHSRSSTLFIFNVPIILSLDSHDPHVFLQEIHEKVVFVLTQSVELRGSLIKAVCIGPAANKSSFFYNVVVTEGDNSVSLKARMHCIPMWTGNISSAISLIVPNDFIDAKGLLRLVVVISK